jgi:hypothetical protein
MDTTAEKTFTTGQGEFPVSRLVDCLNRTATICARVAHYSRKETFKGDFPKLERYRDQFEAEIIETNKMGFPKLARGIARAANGGILVADLEQALFGMAAFIDAEITISIVEA